jgi:hypothetical protein
MTTEITQHNQIPESETFGLQSFDHAQRVAKAIASSSIVPDKYQNNIPNTLIALEMANRIKVSPLMVMQNLHIIQGRPSWSSAFIIALLNSCGRFEPIKFKSFPQSSRAYSIERATGETIYGPTVTIEMAKAEGWFNKPGSKWKTMPELMLMYRSAAFFGRLYAPDLMMGMHMDDELRDVTNSQSTHNRVADLNEKLNNEFIDVPPTQNATT